MLAPYFPGKGYMDHEIAFFTLLTGLSLLGTLPLLGAACVGYELYRLSDRIVHKARRPTYYDTEAQKRFAKIQEQRSKSHRIRHRSSILYPPAPAELLAAWEQASIRGNVKDKLRLGAMMATVEAVVNNDLIRNETGEIVGRKPGVRGWLKENCPELLSHYKSLMHYKVLADKEQIVCGLSDPYPAEVLYAEPFPMAEKSDECVTGNENTCKEITVGPKSCWSGKRGEKAEGERVEITVGPELRLMLRGVRKEAGEWLRWDAAKVGDIMLHARKTAAGLHEEVQKYGTNFSVKQYEDTLFSRLGFIREIRVRPRISRRALRNEPR